MSARRGLVVVAKMAGVAFGIMCAIWFGRMLPSAIEGAFPALIPHVPSTVWVAIGWGVGAMGGVMAPMIVEVVILDLVGQDHHEKPAQVDLPPAYRLSRLLGLIFGARAFRRVFGQIEADAHEEWLEAAKAGDKMAMRAVKIRTPLHLLVAAATYLLAWAAKQVEAIGKISGGGGE